MVQHALNGYNACLMAYGHSGSGKTYTMLGEEWANSEPSSGSACSPQMCDMAGQGLLPRALEMVFNTLQKDSGAVCIGSFYEVYNERVRDLIAPPAPPSSPGRGEEGRGCSDGNKARRPTVHFHPRFGAFVSDATEVPVASLSEALRLVWLGAQARTTAHTGLNERSSRSHAIFVLRMERASASNSLMIVDLAGREQERLTQCRSERFKELTLINRSLFHLARCVRSLAGTSGAGSNSTGEKGNGSQCHHFRNSKLTMLLGHALAGNSHTALMGTISPARGAYEDSLATLRFCESVKQVRTRPVLPSSKREDVVHELQDEVKRLELELARANTGRQQVERQLEETQAMSEHYRCSWKEAIDSTTQQRSHTRPPIVPPLVILPMAGGSTPNAPSQLPSYRRLGKEATGETVLSSTPVPMEGVQYWAGWASPLPPPCPGICAVSQRALASPPLLSSSCHATPRGIRVNPPAFLVNRPIAAGMPFAASFMNPPQDALEGTVPSPDCTSTTASEAPTPRHSTLAQHVAAALLRSQCCEDGNSSPMKRINSPTALLDDDLMRVVDTWVDAVDAGSPCKAGSSKRASLVTTLNQLWTQLVELHGQADKMARLSGTEQPESPRRGPPDSARSSVKSPRHGRERAMSGSSFRSDRDMRIAAAALAMLQTAGMQATHEQVTSEEWCWWLQRATDSGHLPAHGNSWETSPPSLVRVMQPLNARGRAASPPPAARPPPAWTSSAPLRPTTQTGATRHGANLVSRRTSQDASGWTSPRATSPRMPSPARAVLQTRLVGGRTSLNLNAPSLAATAAASPAMAMCHSARRASPSRVAMQSSSAYNTGVVVHLPFSTRTVDLAMTPPPFCNVTIKRTHSAANA